MALKRENETLRQNILMLETLVHHLRNTPEEIARDTLQTLRATSDMRRILPTLNPILQKKLITGCTTPYGFLPSVYSFHDIEIENEHPNAYPQLNSSLRILNSENQVARSTKRQRLMKETTAESEDSDSSFSGSSVPFLTPVSGFGFSSSRPDSKGLAIVCPEDIPRLFDGCFDSVLQKMDIMLWTSVPITNQFFADVISLYLATDHPLLGVFDAELFVGDLIGGTLNFCSPFLVNSLLAFASVSMCVLCYVIKLIVLSKDIHLEIQLRCLKVMTLR
jgi:hypothetical protein